MDDDDDAGDAEGDWGATSHLDDNGQPRIIERWLEVTGELSGLRLDHFVKTQIARLSRTKIQDIIATQLTRADGSRCKPATTVAAGDRFVIRRQARPEPPCPRTFTVLHSDARVLVVDKPALLPVHASAKFYFNTLARVLAERYPDEPELQLCHRLDRETSGCIAIARDRDAAAYVKVAFADRSRSPNASSVPSSGGDNRRVTKEYLAVVYGEPPWDAQTRLDVPLRLSQPGDPTKLPHVRMLPDPRGLPATTLVRVLKRGAYSLVSCTLVTGRQHQIRAHLAHAGFPIVGDKLYAHGDDAFMAYCDEGLTPELAEQFVLARHALHAARIAFPHPDGGTVDVTAPLPADLAGLLR